MAEAKDVRAIGVKREDGGKDYRLEYGGISWLAEKDGSSWVAEGGTYRFRTIKGLKLALIDRAESLSHGVTESTQSAESTQMASVDSVTGRGGIAEDLRAWDCIHPCALLILCRVPMGSETLRTLDAYGYLLDDGNPDVEGALREYSLKYERLVGRSDEFAGNGRVMSEEANDE